MSQDCIVCGGTGVTVSGEPCPNCSKMEESYVPVVAGIPVQYQGVSFDKSFLPSAMSATYGEFLEELLCTIVRDASFYQKNLLICSRPNSGKTIWAYNLYANLIQKGYKTPPLMDVLEARDALSSYDNKETGLLLSSARCAIIKIPRDVPYWLFDSIYSITERRVRNGGFTIFLYGGTIEELVAADKNHTLSHIRGSGAYNTIKVESF